MSNELRLKFRKGDIAAIIIVIALIIGTWAALIPGADTGAAAQIYLDGKLVHEMPLDVDAEYTVSGDYDNVVVVSRGSVSIKESDCPGADCVHSGAVSDAGRSIVCLPNRVEVRVIGGNDEPEVDFVVG